MSPAAKKSLMENLTYVWKYKTYLDAVTLNSQNLKARLSDVQRDVESARCKHLSVNQEAVKWLDEGNKELSSTETFLDSLGSSSSWKSRFKFAKMAETHSNEIKMLMEKCCFKMEVPPLTPTLQSRYKIVPSREKYLERIMEALVGSDNRVIGLYGRKGVGKTMLVKKLVLTLESSQVFNGVAITNARDEQHVGDMQVQLAHCIGLTSIVDVGTNSVLSNAKWIRCVLGNGKKVVIINTLENKLDLDKIGIPYPDANNDCRIVVVSSSLEVCKEMNTHINLEIEPLCQEEARQLFDQLIKPHNIDYAAEIQQVRGSLLSKFLWTPGEIMNLIQSFRNKSLPAEMMVTTDGNGKKTLMIGAEELFFDDPWIPQQGIWRWLTPNPSTSILKVAELIFGWSLYIGMMMKEEWLSAATNYGAYFVYQLTPQASSLRESPVTITGSKITKTLYLDPLTAASKAVEGGGSMPIPTRRKDGWLEIELGTFFNIGRPGNLFRWYVNQSRGIKYGILVQGLEMRPLD